MPFGITKIEIIVALIVISIIGAIIALSIRREYKKERTNMSVEEIKGTDRIDVKVESVEDVYNALDIMSEQAYENIDPNSKVGMWLADKKDKMYQKFDLDRDKLANP